MVAATGLWRSVTSTNSSRSAPNCLTLSIIVLRSGATESPRAFRAEAWVEPNADRIVASACRRSLADPRDVCRLVALGARHHVELHALALRQRPEPFPLEGREVYEHLLAGVVPDEAEALGLVEPLHHALHAVAAHNAALRRNAPRGPGRASPRRHASRRAVRRVAVAAVDRAAGRGNERDLGLASAVGADRGMQFPRDRALGGPSDRCALGAAGPLAIRPAPLAAGRGVREVVL